MEKFYKAIGKLIVFFVVLLTLRHLANMLDLIISERALTVGRGAIIFLLFLLFYAVESEKDERNNY